MCIYICAHTHLCVYLCILSMGVGTRVEKAKYSRLIALAVDITVYTFPCEYFSHTEKEKSLYHAYPMTIAQFK